MSTMTPRKWGKLVDCLWKGGGAEGHCTEIARKLLGKKVRQMSVR